MPPKNNQELEWSKEEEAELGSRILKLRDDQIAALIYLVKIYFDFNDLEDVVAEIRENGKGSGHLPILIFEADSKDNLLWWLDYFEKENKKFTF